MPGDDSEFEDPVESVYGEQSYHPTEEPSGMASSGSMMRPLCADREDMPNKWGDAKLDKVKEKYMKTPSCWCGDVCKVKVSTDRKKSWTEGRIFFVCPNYAHDRALPTNAHDISPSPPPLCKYFTWIDQDVP